MTGSGRHAGRMIAGGLLIFEKGQEESTMVGIWIGKGGLN